MITPNELNMKNCILHKVQKKQSIQRAIILFILQLKLMPQFIIWDIVFYKIEYKGGHKILL